MGGGNINGEPVKVVIINTEYVQTDAVSFKSVVQKLTGKDSTVAADAQKQRRFQSRNHEVAAAGFNTAPPGLDRVMSFKDFDRMLKELPSIDELYRLYAE